MSQARNKRQNNVRAGVFVTLSLVLGLVVFGILTNAWEGMFQSTTSYQVTFSVREGIGMLSEGSQVKLGGVPIGQVNKVTPRVSKGDPTTTIVIEFEIDSQYTLFENATIYTKSGLLGASGWLSIQDVGDGVLATSSTVLLGATQTMVAQLLGTDAEQNISKSLSALRKLSESLSGEAGALNLLLGSKDAESLKSTIDAARSSLAAIDSMTSSVNSAWPEWKESISTILTKSLYLPDQLSDTLTSVQNTLDDVRAEVLPNVEVAMESLKYTMSNLEAISDEYKQSAPAWSNKITNIVGNIDQLTKRAKAAIDSISASPWRLLYRPTDREIAYEQLNAASWQLLSSLSELRDTVEALEVIATSPLAPQEAQSLANTLNENARSFDAARNKLIERMRLDFPNR